MRLIARYRFLCLLASTLLAASFVGTSLHAEEQCLKAAWKAFAGEKYEDAIEYADKCIDDFAKTAEREQEKLNKDKEPVPPTGAVSDAEKDKIFKRGLLNDVAAAYFIKGRSAEYLYRKGGSDASKYKEMAKEAYEATCRYKHGRIWDDRGWFWSPCEAASDRLPLK